MKNLLTASLFVAIGLAPFVAHAAPRGTYNPITGEIEIINDTASALVHVTVLSASGMLTDTPSSMLDIAGTTLKDDSEFPYAFTYLNFPVGAFSTGLTGKAGAIPPDFTFQYRIGSLLNPLIQGTFDYPHFTPDPFPEPTSLALLGCGGVVGLLRLRRRD